MRILFIGPPGAGKGTQGARLTQHLEIAHLSSGDLLREACRKQTPVGVQAAESLKAGRLVPDELVQQIIWERLDRPDCQSGYLLDGFPRTIRQAEALDERLARQGTEINLAIHLVVTEAVLLQRLAIRGRHDDETLVVRQRLTQFEELTRPLLEFYARQGKLREVDAIGSQDEVFARMLAVVEGRNEATRASQGKR